MSGKREPPECPKCDGRLTYIRQEWRQVNLWKFGERSREWERAEIATKSEPAFPPTVICDGPDRHHFGPAKLPEGVLEVLLASLGPDGLAGLPVFELEP